MKATLDNNTGMAFSRPAIFASYIFLAVGIVSTFTNPLVGVPLILLGGFGAFTSSGVQLDSSKKMYRPYTSYYGFKTGKWISMSKFPFLAVLRSTISNTTYSRGQTALTTKDKYFNICLLTQTHREKVIVKRHKNKEAAISDAKLLANELGLEYTQYAPVQAKELKGAIRRVDI